MAEKPSFFESVIDGAVGMVTGALALGAVAAIAGLAIGGGLGAVGITLGAAEGALGMALLGGSALGQIGMATGGMAGLIAGVVKGRDTANVDPQDILNVANISFAQGVAAGRNKTVSEPALDALQQASTQHQDMLKAQQRTLEAAR